LGSVAIEARATPIIRWGWMVGDDPAGVRKNRGVFDLFKRGVDPLAFWSVVVVIGHVCGGYGIATFSVPRPPRQAADGKWRQYETP